ncbi:MAG: hypothetical protein II931_04590, partial [Clostridia bacterium]|nr:hypothetical protein [Clostridia bacterium]
KNTVYYYRVRAIAGTARGAYSVNKYAKTDYLDKATEFKAEEDNENIILTWNEVEGATGYIVYDATDTIKKIVMLKGNTSTTYTDKTLAQGDSKTYTVRAYYLDGSNYYFGTYADKVTVEKQVNTSNE